MIERYCISSETDHHTCLQQCTLSPRRSGLFGLETPICCHQLMKLTDSISTLIHDVTHFGMYCVQL